MSIHIPRVIFRLFHDGVGVNGSSFECAPNDEVINLWATVPFINPNALLAVIG